MDENNSIIKKIGRLVLENGLLVAGVLWVLVALCFCWHFSEHWFRSLCVACIIGWLITLFLGKYRNSGEITAKWRDDESTSAYQQNLTFWQKIKSMTLLDWVREFLIFAFLGVSCYIMYESLDSLWLGESWHNVVFCISLPIFISATLYWTTHWLVSKLPSIDGSGNRAIFIAGCLLMYVLFDFAAFTFNYFHIYSNFAETQVVEQAVKNSDEMYKYLMPKVSEALIKERAEADKETQENTIIAENAKTRINVATEIINTTGRAINGADSITRATVLGKTTKVAGNELAEAVESLNNIQKPTIRDTLAMHTAEVKLIELDSLILRFKEIADSSKFEKQSIKRSIVSLEGQLYGALPDSLQHDSLVVQYHTIINTSSVDQSRALNDLFELLGGNYQENHEVLTTAGEKEVHALLYKESIRSLALSALVDLAPILLALMSALPMLLRRKR